MMICLMGYILSQSFSLTGPCASMQEQCHAWIPFGRMPSMAGLLVQGGLQIVSGSATDARQSFQECVGNPCKSPECVESIDCRGITWDCFTRFKTERGQNMQSHAPTDVHLLNPSVRHVCSDYLAQSGTYLVLAFSVWLVWSFLRLVNGCEYSQHKLNRHIFTIYIYIILCVYNIYI